MLYGIIMINKNMYDLCHCHVIWDEDSISVIIIMWLIFLIDLNCNSELILTENNNF